MNFLKYSEVSSVFRKFRKFKRCFVRCGAGATLTKHFTIALLRSAFKGASPLKPPENSENSVLNFLNFQSGAVFLENSENLKYNFARFGGLKPTARNVYCFTPYKKSDFQKIQIFQKIQKKISVFRKFKVSEKFKSLFCSLGAGDKSPATLAGFGFQANEIKLLNQRSVLENSENLKWRSVFRKFKVSKNSNIILLAWSWR